MTISRIELALMACLSVSIALASDETSLALEPFSSDGCSAFPEGTFEHQELWLQCCIAHDFAYWQGGTYKKRQRADEALQACVKQVGEEEIALLMLAGVRVGGSPYWPTQFRWGYGWPWPRGYKALSEAEQKQIQASILASEEKIQSYIK